MVGGGPRQVGGYWTPAFWPLSRVAAKGRTYGHALTAWTGKVPNWLLVLTGCLMWAVCAWYLELGWKYSLDFEVYRSAGSSLLHGSDPYALVYTWARLPFTYPPIAAIVFIPLSALSTRTSETIWWMSNCLALVGTFYLFLRASFTLAVRRALAIAFFSGGVASLVFEPVRSNMDYGQINAMLLLFVTCDFLCIRSRHRGVLIGIAAALKLTPLIFIVLLLLERDYRSAVRSWFVFLGSVVVGYLLLPHASVRFWSREVFDPERAGRVVAVVNQSLNGLLKRGGIEGPELWILISAAAFLVACLLAKRLLRRASRVEALIVMSLAACLISPVSWVHHWLWVAMLPVPFVLEMRRREWSLAVLTAGVMLIASTEIYFRDWPSFLHPIEENSLVLSGSILLIWWMCFDVIGRAQPTGASKRPDCSCGSSSQRGIRQAGRPRTASCTAPLEHIEDGFLAEVVGRDADSIDLGPRVLYGRLRPPGSYGRLTVYRHTEYVALVSEDLQSLGRYSGPATLILSSLADGSKHGYALTKDIEEFAGVRLAPGTLYAALDRLVGSGLIEGLALEGRRRPYRITAAGVASLRTHLAAQQKIARVGLGRLGVAT